MRDAFAHPGHQQAESVRVVAGGRGQALSFLVALVLVLSRVAAHDQLGDRHAANQRGLGRRLGRALVAGVAVGADVTVVAVGGARRQQSDAEKGTQEVQPRRALLLLQEMLGGDVRDLVPEQVGEHVVGQPQVEHAPGHEDLARRQGEGVGDGSVDDGEGKRVAVEVRVVRHLVADPVDPFLHFRIVQQPVLLHRLGRGRDALLEQGGVRDLDRRGRAGRGQEGGQRDGDGGPQGACGRERVRGVLHEWANWRGARQIPSGRRMRGARSGSRAARDAPPGFRDAIGYPRGGGAGAGGGRGRGPKPPRP